MNYLEHTGKAAEFSEAQRVPAMAIVAAWKSGEKNRIRLANIAIRTLNETIASRVQDDAMIRSVAIALALLWTAPVIPEKVELSNSGVVDLAPFACTDTPRSSVVRRVCYDEARRYLLINARGAYRDYCELPAATFNAFIAALMDGTFLRAEHCGLGP